MRSRTTLLLTFLAVAGCEPKKDPPPAGGGVTPASTAVSPVTGVVSTTTPTAAGGLQGTIGGQSFRPDKVTVEGRALSFSTGKGFFPDMQIKFDLPEGPLEGKQWTFT